MDGRYGEKLRFMGNVIGVSLFNEENYGPHLRGVEGNEKDGSQCNNEEKDSLINKSISSPV